MIYTVAIGSATYRFDPTSPIDLSIPLDFSGDQPRAFGLPRAHAEAFASGGFVGDTRRGGSCNCETVTLNPHGSGTHTECVGHVTVDRVSIADSLRDVLVPAVLLTVSPTPATSGPLAPTDAALADDRVVTRGALEAALRQLGAVPPDAFGAVVIRTLPNLRTKQTIDYSGSNPPYVTVAAMHMLRELGVDHLVLDLPSADRENDGGLLAAHRAFFDVDTSLVPRDARARRRTITEMAYIPEEAADGLYLLCLQVPAFLLDAAPSRALLMRLERAE